MAPKRVHFNDRTSIRSFESLSSDHSNTTAIDRDQLAGQEATFGQQQQQHYNQRLLIGSPDSIGSGSTSRLSCESPDFRRSSSGAAIYAIRGDPELESQATPTHTPTPTPTPTQQLSITQGQAPRLLLLPAPGSNQPLFHPGGTVHVPAMQQHHQQQQQQTISAPQMHYGAQQALGSPSGTSGQPLPAQHPVSVSIAQQHLNQRQQQRHLQQQQHQLGSPPACIRMTAPPAIGPQQVHPARIQAPVYVRPGQLSQQQLIMSAAPVTGGQQRAVGGVRVPLQASQQVPPARPMSLIDMTAPPRGASSNQNQQQLQLQQPVSLEDEDDPDYAFRLRQAASNRVFTFVQQQQQQQQQQQLQSPSSISESGGGGGRGGSGGGQAQRRQPSDRSNFQTEV